MLAEVLEGLILRDARRRLAALRGLLAENDRLDKWLLRLVREAVDDFSEPAPARRPTGTERRFMEGLAKVRSEQRHLDRAANPIEAQWATKRITRGIRNLLRDWPVHGNYRNPRAAVDALTGSLDAATVHVLRRLPYETAEANPVEPTVGPTWTAARESLRPVLDDLKRGATTALRDSLSASSRYRRGDRTAPPRAELGGTD